MNIDAILKQIDEIKEEIETFTPQTEGEIERSLEHFMV